MESLHRKISKGEHQEIEETVKKQNSSSQQCHTADLTLEVLLYTKANTAASVYLSRIHLEKGGF